MANSDPSPSNRFSSANQPTNRRKPSKLKKYIKDCNIDNADVSLMIKNVLFSKSQDELAEILKDTTKPMIIRLFIKAYLSDFKKGNLINLEVLMNRAFGKPDQHLDHGGSMGVAMLTKEERQQEIDRLLEKRGSTNDDTGNA